MQYQSRVAVTCQISRATRRRQRRRACTTSATASRDCRASRRGKTFAYRDAKGRPVRDARTLDRIRSLVIPPAWTTSGSARAPTAICRQRAAMRAAGSSIAIIPSGRPRETSAKYDQMIEFALRAARDPQARARRSAEDRRSRATHVLATVVTLLEKTLIRIGNKEYARANKSFGLTTLLDRARADQRRVGDVSLSRQERRHADDRAQRRDARAHRQADAASCPGEALFQYRRRRRKAAVRRFRCRQRVSSRDHRAIRLPRRISEPGPGPCSPPRPSATCRQCTSDTAFKRNIVRAVDSVAAKLGNTRAVCRKLLHPSGGVRGLSGGRDDRRREGRAADGRSVR